MKARYCFILCCVVAAVSVLVSLNAAAADPKQVVVLHSYGQDFKPWSDYAKALRQELDRQSPWPLNIQDFSVITARNRDESAEIQFAAYLNALFSRDAPDIIVAFGAPAAAFLQRHRADLFPTTPVVLTAVDQRRVRETALTGKDAVVARAAQHSCVVWKHPAVASRYKDHRCADRKFSNERFWIEEMQRELEPLKDRVKIFSTMNYRLRIRSRGLRRFHRIAQYSGPSRKST